MADHSVGEANPHLFQPDTMLPSQYFAAALRRKGALKPERRLIIAILQDAIECYQKHLFARDGKARQLFSDAQEWIDSEDRSHYFSYENLCEILDVNPGFMRRGLHEWRRRQLDMRRSDKGALGKLNLRTLAGGSVRQPEPLRKAG
jgi:hypothetical protein